MNNKMFRLNLKQPKINDYLFAEDEYKALAAFRKIHQVALIGVPDKKIMKAITEVK